MRRLFALVVCIICLFTYGVSAEGISDYEDMLQTDYRWADMPLGTGGYTIGEAGCAVTSVTMLMAYANPENQDINSFNPGLNASTLAPNGLLQWGNTTQLDKTFRLVKNMNGLSEDPLKVVIDSMNDGYYVIIYSSSVGPIGHYSPIVGVEDGVPQIWDVGSGYLNSWSYWESRGINQILIYESSINPSYNTLNSSTNDMSSQEMSERRDAWVKLVEEQELIGMGKEFKFDATVQLPTYDSLNNVEKDSLEDIKVNINAENDSWFSWIRVCVSFLGILVILYGLFLLLAYFFDRVNTVVDISLLYVVTLGKYRVAYDDTTVKKDNVTICSLGYIISRVVVVEIVGFAIINGYIFDILYNIFINLF